MKPQLFPLSVLLRTLPDAVHAELLSRAFNHLLQGQEAAEQLLELEGKRLGIAILDTGNQLVFEVVGGAFRRVALGGWDVRISGSLEGFWRLATRSEDPDTLFFNRQLALEGETATGLYLKNLLDGMEFDRQAHLTAVLGPSLGAVVGRALTRSGLESRLRRWVV